MKREINRKTFNPFILVSRAAKSTDKIDGARTLCSLT